MIALSCLKSCVLNDSWLFADILYLNMQKISDLPWMLSERISSSQNCVRSSHATCSSVGPSHANKAHYVDNLCPELRMARYVNFS